jgi:hypothetical protein
MAAEVLYGAPGNVMEAPKKDATEGTEDADFSKDLLDAVKQQKRWTRELEAAEKETKDVRKQGKEIVARYLEKQARDNKSTRSYFTANVQTKEAVFYGKTPKVDVERKWNDANDDTARVACVILERLLNADIHRAEDEYATAMGMCLNDKMLSGMGWARVHYRPTFEKVPAEPAKTEADPNTGEEVVLAPEVPETEKKTGEEVETEYVYWEDVLWSPCRHFAQMRWVAFKLYLTRTQLKERWPKRAELIALNAKTDGEAAKDGSNADSQMNDPREQAVVWEIHSKEDGKIFWVSKGHDMCLEVKDDPLGLTGFWSFGKPMMANLTSSAFVPRADFTLTEDAYNALDVTSTRIAKLKSAIKVVGLYDGSDDSLKRVLKEAADLDMLPVERWAAFAEKGGLKASMDFLPIEMFAETLKTMLGIKAEEKQELFELTGMSDLLRGEGDANETATAQGIKAKFASVRLQRERDEFARFCSEHQRVRAEIICRHFDPTTIIKRSNILKTADGENQQLIADAVQLLKTDFSQLRIEVKPESVSLEDFAETRNEAAEVVGVVGQVTQAFAPLMQMAPQIIGPLLGEVLGWVFAQVKGGKKLEPFFDAAVTQAKKQAEQAAAQPQQPPSPDPKVVATQMKGQLDIQKVKTEHVAKMQQIQAEGAQDIQHQQVQTQGNIMELQARERARVDAQIDNVLRPPGSAG